MLGFLENSLPFLLLILTLLSLDLNRPALRNTIRVTIGCFAVWITKPEDSPWGTLIAFVLLALTISMSPLRVLLASSESEQQPPPEQNHAVENRGPIQVLHDSDTAKVE